MRPMMKCGHVAKAYRKDGDKMTERRHRMDADRVHPCERPRFGMTIRTVQADCQTVLCLTCRKRVPRWAAQEQQQRKATQ